LIGGRLTARDTGIRPACRANLIPRDGCIELSRAFIPQLFIDVLRDIRRGLFHVKCQRFVD
jgi:hypothetical protein